MTEHRLVITRSSMSLEHPASCDLARECAEGRYERRFGLDCFELQGSGVYLVSWWGSFYDGEWSEGMAVVHAAPADESYYPEDSDPQPDSSVVRGFPYSGGRWSA